MRGWGREKKEKEEQEENGKILISREPGSWMKGIQDFFVSFSVTLK